MIRVHRDHRGLAFGRQSARHGLCHLLRRGDGQTRMPAQHFHVVDCRERFIHLCNAAGRKGQRIAARQYDLPNPFMGAHIVHRGGEVACAQGPRAGAHPLATEAEAAIDCANRDQFNQDPIGIPMHQPLDGAHGVVADRIVALGGIAGQLSRVGHELMRDRVAAVFGLDEGGERRRKADSIAVGDRLELCKSFRASQPHLDEIRGAGQAAAVAS